MAVHGYLALGSDGHLAASGEDVEDLIEDVEFPSQEALYWFRLGMSRAEGYSEGWLFDDRGEAVKHVKAAMDDDDQSHEEDSE